MKQRTVLATAAALALLCLAATASASIEPRWSDRELANFSEVIVTGRVVSTVSAWDPAAGTIYTYVTLDVTGVLKGAVSSGRITIKQLGGRVDDIGLRVADQPIFVPGEETLLFLEVRPRDGTLYTAANWQGKWTLSVDGSGERVASRVVAAFSQREQRSLAAFASVIRESAALAPALHGPLNLQPVEAPVTDGRIAEPFVLIDPNTPYRFNEFDSGGTVNVDTQTGGQSGLAGGGATEVNTALTLWNNAGSAVRMALASTSGPARCTSQNPANGRVEISYNDPCGEISNSGGTLAVGGAWFTFSGGRTVNGVGFGRVVSGFVVNNDSSTALNFLRRSRCFQDIETHEIGHVLGLGHSTDPGSIMQAFIDNACLSFPVEGLDGEGVTGSLGADDIAGIRFIYPGGAPPPPPPGVPAAPTNLTAQVNGLNVTLNWGASAGATSYQLEAGTASGLANAFLGDVGNVTTLNAAGPAGTFFVRVKAKNAAGISGPSNEVIVVLGGGPGPCTTAPPPPTNLTFSVAGANVTLNWNASAGAISYVVEAGSATGLANLFNANVGSVTGLNAAAPPGTYFVRVKGVNACGTSGPSNEVIITVP